MIIRASLLALALLFTAAKPAQTAFDLLDQAKTAYDKKEYARSADLYRQAYRLDGKELLALYNEACSLALAGKKEAAFASLKELADKAYNNVEHLKTDTDFATLRDDPRWESIVAKVAENAKRNPPVPAWRRPFRDVPVPTDPAPFEARLGGEASAVWQEGDVLSFLVRDKGASMFLIGGIQEPMHRIGSSDLWIAQYRMADWSQAFVTYHFVGAQLGMGQRIQSKFWSGPNAPTYEKAKTLQGAVVERTIHSDALGEDRKIHVYLPPDAPKKGLPAFFMADGDGCESFAKALEPLILAGKVRPCAIVGVDNGGYRGDRKSGTYDQDVDFRAKEYIPELDDDRFARHLRFFIDEVGAYVAKEFGVSRKRADLAVTGFSNGGAFSAAVAYRRPEAFGTSMPLSLGIPTKDPKPSKPFPRMMFAAGMLETFNVSTQWMFEKMKKEGANATYETYVAGHDSEQWNLAFSRMAPRVFPKR